MRILAIETSCDETALALVEATGGLRAPRFRVIKNLVSSQIEVHRPWGGVVPNLAKREHIKNLPVVLHDLQAQVKRLRPDLLAVTVGPGLEPALWAGIVFAKELHRELKKANPRLPLIGANHLEGHLYSFLVDHRGGLKGLFPAIALIVSGGHTILLRLESLTKWKKLGETRDDAVGEAFDKTAKILGLPYPGGPEIQRVSVHGDPAAIPFPRPMLHSGDYDFSFSGLKTAVLYYIRDNKPKVVRKDWIADVAASFQEAALDVLEAKVDRAARECGARSILLSGGVAANPFLRERLKTRSEKLDIAFIVPPATFSTDNATMIAVAAYIEHLRKKNHRLIANGTMTV